MVFSSFTFLFIFLPAVLALYYLAPRAARNFVLLLASLIFYAWGAPTIVPILVLSCAADFLISKKLHGTQAKFFLTLGVTINLLLLGYYKYANFFIAESTRVLELLGMAAPTWTAVVLPVGISFFTFQKISYLVDVSRGTARVARNIGDYLLYVTLFPQLIAGPIVRYHDVAEQIKQRPSTSDLFFEGLLRFSIGLGKKVLIADALGAVADNVFKVPESQLTSSYAWLGIVCYSFQIYYDFSGYSDMAIGLGLMFGFRFLENFNFPYLSTTITEFWRRWHISLSNFMREYLYLPLGGNRAGTARTYLNLWIVFFCSGLWHGAAWNFVVWGLFHGAFLVLDRLGWAAVSSRLPTFVQVALTYLIVLVGWVFFRAQSLESAVDYLSRMFWVSTPTELFSSFRGDIISNRGIVILLVCSLATFAPIFVGKPKFRANNFWASIALISLVLSVLSLASADFSPFLYFRF